MAENSLFAVLMRSRWWISFAICAAVVLVFLAYTCDAFGFVPHTVFWVDYLDRELHLGAGYASMQWAFFGLGAIAGPLAAAFCASRWGW